MPRSTNNNIINPTCSRYTLENCVATVLLWRGRVLILHLLLTGRASNLAMELPDALSYFLKERQSHDNARSQIR